MCDKWSKQKQGVFLSITCKCGNYCIRKNRDGSYSTLTASGATWKDIGFKTADDAKRHINENT